MTVQPNGSYDAARLLCNMLLDNMLNWVFFGSGHLGLQHICVLINSHCIDFVNINWLFRGDIEVCCTALMSSTVEFRTVSMYFCTISLVVDV